MPNHPTHSTRWIEGQKGQVLIIFALTAVVLFAIMGLAVDAGISYLHSDQQEKAAEAAALSGVSYLPGDLTDAKGEAVLTANRNGYSSAQNGTTITVTQPTASSGTVETNELTVAITALAPVYFLELLGFGQHEVTSYATAEYLPPILLGQPGNELGATLSDLGDPGTNDFYFLRTAGWGDPRSEGDAFTPTPDDPSTGCNGSCSASPPDMHQVSCVDGTDACDGVSSGPDDYAGMQVNDTGGYNYLIYVPAGGTEDVQIYNPSFDPGNDTNCSSATPSCLYTYHDDDGSFPTLTSYNPSTSSVPPTDFAAMGYTLYAVPQLYSRSSDVPLLQDVFCPFNAYDLDQGTSEYSYYADGSGKNATSCTPGSTATPTLTTVSSSKNTPTVYDKWVSLLTYPATVSGDSADLFDQTFENTTGLAQYGVADGSSYYLSGGSAGQYFRLRVDTLNWTGTAVNTSRSSDSSSPTTPNSTDLPDGYPLSHAGYAVQVVNSNGSSCSSGSTGCTISALGDMEIYTPVDGATTPSFQVPLFYLPTSYAGDEITVNVFDPGDVGGGAAYLGIYQPQYTSASSGKQVAAQFGTLSTLGGGTGVSDIGSSLGAGLDSAITPSDGSVKIASTSAVVQTAASNGGGAIYNGQWVQYNIAVPTDYTDNSSVTCVTTGTTCPGYWNLYYQVAGSSYAGDTITVEVSYRGSPVHLLSPTA